MYSFSFAVAIHCSPLWDYIDGYFCGLQGVIFLCGETQLTPRSQQEIFIFLPFPLPLGIRLEYPNNETSETLEET